MEDWRIPNEEEKKHIQSWIKKNLIFTYAFLVFFLAAMLMGIYVVEAWAIWRRGFVKGQDWFTLIFFLIFLGIGIAINSLNLLASIELYRMNDRDMDCCITDGKAVGYNWLIHTLEVTYFENNEIKVKQITPPYGMSDVADNNESGFIVYFFLRKKIFRWSYLEYAFIPVKDGGEEYGFSA